MGASAVHLHKLDAVQETAERLCQISFQPLVISSQGQCYWSAVKVAGLSMSEASPEFSPILFSETHPRCLRYINDDTLLLWSIGFIHKEFPGLDFHCLVYYCFGLEGERSSRGIFCCASFFTETLPQQTIHTNTRSSFKALSLVLHINTRNTARHRLPRLVSCCLFCYCTTFRIHPVFFVVLFDLSAAEMCRFCHLP